MCLLIGVLARGEGFSILGFVSLERERRVNLVLVLGLQRVASRDHKALRKRGYTEGL